MLTTLRRRRPRRRTATGGGVVVKAGLQAVGVAASATVVAILNVVVVPRAEQSQPATVSVGTEAQAGQAPWTPWGAPDLQGIWTSEFETPLQRPARYANIEFFTAEERAGLDRRR